LSWGNYLSSTSAPASSKEDFKPSASSFETASLTLAGAESTSPLASLRPSPVSSLTSLTTANLEAPADLRTTVNSVCSSADSPPPAAGPAAATAAAAGSFYHTRLLK